MRARQLSRTQAAMSLSSRLKLRKKLSASGSSARDSASSRLTMKRPIQFPHHGSRIE